MPVKGLDIYRIGKNFSTEKVLCKLRLQASEQVRRIYWLESVFLLFSLIPAGFAPPGEFLFLCVRKR